MKRLFPLALAIMLLLAGCSQATSSSETTTTLSSTTTLQSTTALQTTINVAQDNAIAVAGVEFTIPGTWESKSNSEGLASFSDESGCGISLSVVDGYLESGYLDMAMDELISGFIQEASFSETAREDASLDGGTWRRLNGHGIINEAGCTMICYMASSAAQDKSIIGLIIIPEGIDVNRSEAGLITALNSCNLHIDDTNMQATTTTIPDKADLKETLGQKNAREQALSYLSFMPFSYDGLVEQLEYEGYTHEEAIYAVDACNADWNSQALLKAKSYLDTMAFSYKGLIEQLEYEGFSTEQATYGADSCGANWNEQAAMKAKSYLETMSFSRSGLIEQLKYEGFTTEQAEYGAAQNGY